MYPVWAGVPARNKEVERARRSYEELGQAARYMQNRLEDTEQMLKGAVAMLNAAIRIVRPDHPELADLWDEQVKASMALLVGAPSPPSPE